tara:strand:- start:565 stop:1416 length:852 start_codon:yes stop_codon:yes gene_type:complete
MKILKYFLQFLFVIILFLIFKIIGLKYSSKLSGNIFSFLGPFFRSNKICHKNLIFAFPDLNEYERQKILKNMWLNYGKIFSEYLFINKLKTADNLIIRNQEMLEKIKKRKEPVIFISGHFNNFELMAMHLERSGIDVAAIYRPLNNIFLNPIMEYIRKKYICKKQIKKGISGTKEILKKYKNGTSIALMIDQRVSEGIKSNFFGHEAFTTTIPAQFVKKFNTKIVPVYIERSADDKFHLEILEEITFSKNETLDDITANLNKVLENMIKKNADQWIWTHNRWK